MNLLKTMTIGIIWITSEVQRNRTIRVAHKRLLVYSSKSVSVKPPFSNYAAKPQKRQLQNNQALINDSARRTPEEDWGFNPISFRM